MMMKNKKEYYWNEDTVDHFKFTSAYISKDEVLKEVQEFVEIDCTFENGDTEKYLVNDLMNKIYDND